MKKYRYITLKEEPVIKDMAAEWFHSKWGVPKDVYLECMNTYLNEKTICKAEKNILVGNIKNS